MFSSKEVADVLRPGFVEARLHTDMTESMPGYAKYNKRIQEVRTKYLGAGNLGLPHYFVFDPANLDRPVVNRSGKASRQVFREFFEAARSKGGKSGG